MCVHISCLKVLVSPACREKRRSLPTKGSPWTRQPGQGSPRHPPLLTTEANSHEGRRRRQAKRRGEVGQGDLLNYLCSGKGNTPTPQEREGRSQSCCSDSHQGVKGLGNGAGEAGRCTAPLGARKPAKSTDSPEETRLSGSETVSAPEGGRLPLQSDGKAAAGTGRLPGCCPNNLGQTQEFEVKAVALNSRLLSPPHPFRPGFTLRAAVPPQRCTSRSPWPWPCSSSGGPVPPWQAASTCFLRRL